MKKGFSNSWTTVMGWTAPRAASTCQDGRCQNPSEGSRPWESLSTNLASVTRVGARSGEEGLPGPCGRCDGRGRGGASAIGATSCWNSSLQLPPCLVAMEACSSAHHWGRALIELGHRGEADPAGACEALCSAQQERRRRRGGNLRGGSMRPDSGSCRSDRSRTRRNSCAIARARFWPANARRMLNALRGHLAEIGVIAAQGAQHAYELKRMLSPTAATRTARSSFPNACARRWRRWANRSTRSTRRSRPSTKRSRRLVEGRRYGAAADDDPRRRAAHRLRDRGDGSRHERVRQRSRVRRLSRPHAAPAFERRQGAARTHHQDGRPLPAQAARRGRLRRAQPSRGPQRRAAALGQSDCWSARRSNTSSS